MSKVKLLTIENVDPQEAERLMKKRKRFFKVRNSARKKRRGWL
jgi:hypothetical protein